MANTLAVDIRKATTERARAANKTIRRVNVDRDMKFTFRKIFPTGYFGYFEDISSD